MKYNKALDFAALAVNAATKGKNILAAKLFARAVASADAPDMLRIIEASNGKAYDEQVALAAAAKAKVEAAAKAKKVDVKAAKRVAASDAVGQDDIVAEDECSDEELGADLVEEVMDNDEDTMTEDVPQEELAGELDELEDDVDADEDPVDDTAAFAAVLSSMRAKSAGKAKK